MLDESSTLNEETPEPQPEEKGNRTFLIVGGIFAALIILTIACLAGYFLVLAPRLEANRAAQTATVEAQAVETADALAATEDAALAALASPTAPVIPTATRTKTVPAPTATAVVVVATPEISAADATATQVALETQLALQATQTIEASLATSTTDPTHVAATQTTAALLAGTAAAGGATPLPSTGFFDEVGLPLLIVLTFALVAVIFITRRLRKSPTR
jgi:cytoskeletal protein RodZ